ncbi:Ankyrin repeat-containing protein [Penicillium riverlandense]|uniref:Ankyrin repeat-containing protein n=1 Tax=Penicillium riverlandense TaxID=1903569 RepID=UPI002547CD06|nr:Ankyrin repeat-containing protein [Penicillium riverlandense]KAJ5833328.1 Ankyrin repeat-containing protein [Penicillium riverlandense]
MESSPEPDGFVVVDVGGENPDEPHTPDRESLDNGQTIKEWLEPTDYDSEASEYKKHLASRVPGTGDWIYDTAEYQRWLSSGTPLWIKAVAGAGKSVLAASLISTLAQRGGPVLFFFFRQIIAENHDCHTLVRDWISQTMAYSPALRSQIAQLMTENNSAKDITLEELWGFLVDALSALPNAYCVVDALDEMDAKQIDFLHKLIQLGNSAKLVMTSRPLPHIQNILRHSVVELRMDSEQMNRDIPVYIDWRLSQENMIQSEVKQVIQTDTQARTHQSFLSTRLILDELLKDPAALCPESTQKLLQSLPRKLEDIYTQMIHDHSHRSNVPQERQILIFQWVTHAKRPLRLLEITALLNFHDGTENTKETVRKACGPLLEILEDETVSVIHHSFTEFLLDLSRDATAFPVIESSNCRFILASTCLRYLMAIPSSKWNGFWDEGRKSRSENSTHLDYPFVQYSMENWPFHAREAPMRNDLLQLLHTFISKDNLGLIAWASKFMPREDQHQSQDENQEPWGSEIHVGAFTGITDYVRHIIGTSDVSQTDIEKRTPLFHAAFLGHDECVGLLLNQGAKPDVVDSVGRQPIHYAARANRYNAVRLLLSAGVSPLVTVSKRDEKHESPRRQSDFGFSALQVACKAGYVESVREMVSVVKPDDLNSCLYWAASAGHTNVMKFLLNLPSVDVDALHEGNSPLFIAAKNAHSSAIALLLKHDADPHLRSRGLSIEGKSIDKHEIGYTPLHSLTGSEETTVYQRDLHECLQLLLHAGCDVNAQDNIGRSPLHNSAAHNLTITTALLENGADPMLMDDSGETPLHKYRSGIMVPYVREDDGSGLRAFVEHGARVDVRDRENGKPAFWNAVLAEDDSSFEHWVPFVSDWNMQDYDGFSVLHFAMRHSRDGGIIKKLLELGADPTIRNHHLETPLNSLGDWGYDEDCVQVLVDAGADLESKDDLGNTLLLHTVASRQAYLCKAVRHLLHLGADVNVRDHFGNGVLHVRGMDLELLKLLLEAGADPLMDNHEGWTPLHSIMLTPSIKLMEKAQLLINAGISSTAQCHNGLTPFHHFCYHEPYLLAQGFKQTEGEGIALLDRVLASDLAAGVNIPDYENVYPIHLAAVRSEALFSRLVDHGADLTVLTRASRNVLHVAAITRQTGILSLALEKCSPGDRAKLVNQKSLAGRTPLHDACRSGKYESVALLLQANADVMARDKNGLTPLHACAELPREQDLWDIDLNKFKGPEMAILDSFRPDPKKSEQPQSFYGKVCNEVHNARVKGIIHLLLDHGADIAATDNVGGTPLDIAVDDEFSEMITVLAPLVDQAGKGRTPGRRFEEKYFTLNSEPIISILEEQLSEGDSVHRMGLHLLQNREYECLEFLASKADMRKRDSDLTDPSVMTTLAWLGYPELFKTLGKTIQDPGWVNGGPGEEPYLLAAAKRSSANLDVIKVIVEVFEADVNVMSHEGALHILALATRWWQASAIEYLAQHGADLNLRNAEGETALHLAVRARKIWHTAYREKEIVQLLLRLGANPDVMDNNGRTPLALSAQNPEIFKIMVQHGADINFGNYPVLYSAMESQNVDAVTFLLDSGLDCNKMIRVPNCPLDPWNDHRGNQILVEEYYPLHYAGQAKWNQPDKRQKAAHIIHQFLEHGADVFLPFCGSTILHIIVQEGGIMEPFLSIPDLDLETRDGHGRTLLLAACMCNFPMDCGRLEWYDRCHNPEAPRAPTRAKILYDKNADLSAVDEYSNNAIHLLVISTQEPTPLERDPEENTVLHYLAESMVEPSELPGQIFNRLVAAGVEANALNQKGENLMFPYCRELAVCDYRPRVIWHIDVLLNTGADIFAVNNEGCTLLHALAASNGDKHKPYPDGIKAFKRLLDLGVDPMKEDNRQRTAVDMAAAYYNTPILELFQKK